MLATNAPYHTGPGNPQRCLLTTLLHGSAGWRRELGGVGRRPLPGCLDPCRFSPLALKIMASPRTGGDKVDHYARRAANAINLRQALALLHGSGCGRTETKPCAG